MDRGVEKAGAALDRGGRSECCVSGRARMRTVQLVVEGFRGRVQVARGCPNPRRFQLPFVPACSNLRATNEKNPVACFDKVEWNSECLFRCFGRSCGMQGVAPDEARKILEKHPETNLHHRLSCMQTEHFRPDVKELRIEFRLFAAKLHSTAVSDSHLTALARTIPKSRCSEVRRNLPFMLVSKCRPSQVNDLPFLPCRKFQSS